MDQLAPGTHQTIEDTIVRKVTTTSTALIDRYTFNNFFHPFVGNFVEKLNKKSLQGLLDAEFHEKLKTENNPALSNGSIDSFYRNFSYDKPNNRDAITVKGFPKEVDLSVNGPYANYNWELLFHVPLTIAIHLSKNQRFAEAQHWFHYIFDPTSNDTSQPAPERYWRFLKFRGTDTTRVDEMVAMLSKPAGELSAAEREAQKELLCGLNAIKNKPFQPHVVARTRHVSYQYNVVMKYLDNLIAWGDSLFMQDTIESINEATQLYVLASNILGKQPQRIPPTGTVRPESYKQLKDQGMGPIGNAFVELEHQLPFNGSLATLTDDTEAASALFGIGRTLYFCVPSNEKLLGYWDTVGDRLYKIRHCMNIEGVTRQLALFDPPLDPGMLVKATAAGIDVGSIVSGLNQPIGPMRCLFLIQKALELCGEVRGLGAALLSAIEKGDGERLTLLRQAHEIKIQELARDVRFLQWKQAQGSTESLLNSRASALERYRYYLRVLGKRPDSDAAPDELALERPVLTEENFDEVFDSLVGQYDREVPIEDYPPFEAKQEGRLYLHKGEYDELNEHAESAHFARKSAAEVEAVAAVSAYLPNWEIDLAYWGLGTSTEVPVSRVIQDAARAISSGFNVWAIIEEERGRNAGKTASYERRADDWLLQVNLSARELKQIGRQIVGSLLAEQVAYREYQNIQKQIEQSQEVDRFLNEKFSNEELYAWMQGELTRLYYAYYRFAFDTARKAERMMKHELMRPEVDATDYIKFNYWDGGRKGLLSGEALYLDIKRMEMAYHENNRREYELTKHISLRQLDPLALLTLRATGKCEFHIPEWLCDLDCGGHYMRRIKHVNLSIPAVTGPLTSMNCTLSLLRSSVRKSTSLDEEYPRQGSEDPRFVDYVGQIESIVTSSGSNDGGMFETNLRDERFLPFEGAGMISTWRLDLPTEFRQFDYNTISDVVLHISYTSRQGGDPLKGAATQNLEDLFGDETKSDLFLLLDLKHDFPGEWAQFEKATNEADETETVAFAAALSRDYFPYLTQGRQIRVTDTVLCKLDSGSLEEVRPSPSPLGEIPDGGATFELAVRPEGEHFVLLKYTIE